MSDATTTCDPPTAWAKPVRSAAKPYGNLDAICDPEWLLFTAFLFLPALFCLALAQPLQASFFAGTAIYLATLKWLGWLCLTRRGTRQPEYALFAAEIFAGLALVVAWFYFRSLIGMLWPAGYSLGELSVLPWLAVAVHVLHGLKQGKAWRAVLLDRQAIVTALSRRGSLYLPFVVLLTVALWQVSGTLGVHGSDAFHFAFCTRVYLQDGFFFRGFHGGYTILYPTGFGAVSATAVALAPLSVVQAVNMLHPVLLLAGLFLVTGGLAALTGRSLWWLHALAVPFTATFPLYGLFPFLSYQGPGRQAAPALLLAVCFLPALALLRHFADLVCLMACTALLAVLTVAINPACAPFAVVSSLAALLLLSRRAANELGQPVLKTIGIQAAFAIAAGLLMLSADPYYGHLAGYLDCAPPNAEAAAPSAAEPAFSFSSAVAALPSLDWFGLTTEKLTFPIYTNLPEFHGWQHKPPHPLLLWSVFTLGCMHLLLGLVRRDLVFPVPGSRALLWTTTACLLLWPTLKIIMLSLAEGMALERVDTALLGSYLRLLLIRIELLIAFILVASSMVGLLLLGEQTLATLAIWRVARVAAWVVMPWLPYAMLAGYTCRSGFVTLPNTRWGVIKADDLELVRWIAEQIPPDAGRIALASNTLRLGQGGGEHHIYPVHGAQALPLYGRRYQYCFTLNDAGDVLRPAEYDHHVRDHLDVDWCRGKDIRYFYVPTSGLPQNPGLKGAIASGSLRLLKGNATSSVYELTEATP